MIGLLFVLVPTAALVGRHLRYGLTVRRARRARADRVEHERLTSWITDTGDPGAPTLPLFRTSGGLVVMSPAAAGLVAAGKLTSRHKTG